METYKPIPNTNNRYFVSDLGNIKSYTKSIEGFVMKQKTDTNNYKQVNIFVGGKHITYRIHILVALVFMGETPKGHNIDHKDQNKQNNKLDNLQFLTIRQNVSKAQTIAKKSNLPTGIKRQPPNSYSALIRHKKGRYHLGSSKDLNHCVMLYQTALEQIENGTFDPATFKQQYNK